MQKRGGSMKKDRFCSIMIKIRFAFLTLFAAFLLIIIYILGFQYKNRAIDDIIRQLKYEDEILAQSLEARIQNTKSSVNTIIIHLNEVLSSPDLMENGGPVINTQTQYLIYNCMINTFTTFYDAEQVMVVWNNGVTWYENRTENYSMQEGGEALLKEMGELGVDRNGSWLMKISSDTQIGGVGYYFAKQYVDIETGKELGYVVLKAADIFEGMENKNSDRMIYLFDPSGSLIQSSDEEAIRKRDAYSESDEGLGYSLRLKEELLSRKSNRQQAINVIQLAGGWDMISVTSMGKELTQLNRSIISILLASLFAAVFIYIVIYLIVKRIIQPIQILSNHMVESHGRLPAPISLPRLNDEVGVLLVHFNEMAKDNEQLVHMLLEEKKQQEQLKLSLLQSQIKPHFLYNTLDTIYCLVIMGKNEEGSRMTKLLSDYYRHVLSHGMDWVLLSEEVQQTQKYLEIQKIRYRDTLEFSVQVDDNVKKNIKIPKLTLQPLVENAIYHGIKPLGRKGHLNLEISQKADLVSIRIKDDGVGFSQERFEESIVNDCSSAGGFGLRNVVDRLKIYYENHCWIHLEECREGTCLLIELQI